MSILADLFVTSIEEARNYDPGIDERSTLLEKYSPREYTGLIDLAFSNLWAIVVSEEWSSEKHSLELVEMPEHGEQWLYRFPKEFVCVLATISSSELIALAMEWVKTEELSGWAPYDVMSIISDLVELATHSIKTDKDLFLWGSL